MRTSRAQWQRYLLNSQKKKEIKTKRWVSALNWTQTTKLKKTYTHDTNSFKQANGKGRCVGQTKTITHGLKMFFFWSFVTCHERATAWPYHVGASQRYCVSHLSSRGSDGVLTMQVSWVKDNPNMRTVKKGRHTWGRRSEPHYYTYLYIVNVDHTLSCTQRVNRRQGVRCAMPWSFRSPRVAKDLRRSFNFLPYVH